MYKMKLYIHKPKAVISGRYHVYNVCLDVLGRPQESEICFGNL